MNRREQYKECLNCNEFYHKKEFVIIDNEEMCNTCLQDNVSTKDVVSCAVCKNLHFTDGMNKVEDDLVCDDCLDYNNAQCTRCQEYYYTDNMTYINEDEHLCNGCDISVNYKY